MFFVCGGVVVVAVVLVFGKCGCLKVSFTTHKRIFFGVHFGCFGFVFRSVFLLLFISFVVIVNFDFFNFYFWHFSVWSSVCAVHTAAAVIAAGVGAAATTEISYNFCYLCEFVGVDDGHRRRCVVLHVFNRSAADEM